MRLRSADPTRRRPDRAIEKTKIARARKKEDRQILLLVCPYSCAPFNLASFPRSDVEGLLFLVKLHEAILRGYAPVLKLGGAHIVVCRFAEKLVRDLDKLLFELNELDLLHEDRRIEVMPRLADYLDLGVEVIAEKVEITEEPDEEETEAEDAFEKSA